MAQLIRDHPELNRAQLSRRVCRHLGWYKPDGETKQMSCRVAMLRMQRDGLISLPPPRGRTGPVRIQFSAQTEPQAPLTQPLHQLPRPKLSLVTQPKQSRLWNEYIHRYHYLGYQPLPGAQLRYFVTIDAQPVAALGFAAAAWKTAPRDDYIGWNAAQRQRNLALIVNQARFLILPWIRSHNLASWILAHSARILPVDWQQRYHIRPLLLETFVDSERFRGTCYKAANWTYVGQTTGRGKCSTSKQQVLPVKDIWLYPLCRNFRQLLKES